MSQAVRLEVCVEAPAGALAAQQGGADRVELCAALPLGGLTPSAGAIEQARAVARIGLVVLVRPRPGDFLYDRGELATMAADIARARAAGADGVALGVLCRDGTVDVARTAELIAAARPMQVAFHRAFDKTRDLHEALDALLGLGVDRVLTSGGKQAAPAAQDTLAALVQQAGGRLSVMPGGGVRAEMVAAVVRATGCRDVHFSAGVEAASAMSFRKAEPALGGDDRWLTTAAAVVQRYREALARG